MGDERGLGIKGVTLVATETEDHTLFPYVFSIRI